MPLDRFNCQMMLWNGGDEGDRTPDLRNAIATLSQLSYVPIPLGGRHYGDNTRLASAPSDAGQVFCARPAKRLSALPRRQW